MAASSPQCHRGIVLVKISRSITWSRPLHDMKLNCRPQVKLRLLQERVQSPTDWIVIADSDEFYDFSVLGGGVQVGSMHQMAPPNVWEPVQCSALAHTTCRCGRSTSSRVLQQLQPSGGSSSHFCRWQAGLQSMSPTTDRLCLLISSFCRSM